MFYLDGHHGMPPWSPFGPFRSPAILASRFFARRFPRRRRSDECVRDLPRIPPAMNPSSLQVRDFPIRARAASRRDRGIGFCVHAMRVCVFRKLDQSFMENFSGMRFDVTSLRGSVAFLPPRANTHHVSSSRRRRD